MERKLLPALRKMKDDIHVVGNISDGFDEKAMKYFPKKQKGLHVQSLNELKSLSHNPNVPEDCSDDFEIHHVKMVEFLYIYTWVDLFPNSQFYEKTNTGSTFQCCWRTHF